MSKPPADACTPQSVDALCRAGGLVLPDAAPDLLAHYIAQVCKWNKVMNLVGPYNWQEILTLLVADSIHLAEFLRTLPLPPEPRCQDLGAGAGLPGIPLRILWQPGSYTLVEVREKRALFLKTLLAARPLPGTAVFHGRAEAFMEAQPAMDLTVSRAFMPWEKVLELIDPHTAQGGFCVFLTLAPLPERMPAGWTAVAETHYTVGPDTRYLWALRKQ